MGDGVGVGLDRRQKLARLHHRDDALAGLEPIETVEGHCLGQIGAVWQVNMKIHVAFEPDSRLRIEDIDHAQVLALANFKIVEIVRGRHLHRAGADFRIGIFVGDDGDAAADQRQDHVLADEILVALVPRVHGDAGIAEHGLGPRRRDGDKAPRLVLDRIAEVPEMALDLELLHFEIGNRRLEFRIPVHQPLVAIHQPLAIELDKETQNRLREAVIHGEALARPVAGGADALQLAADAPTRFLLEGPDLFEEFLAPEAAAVGAALCGELALDHHLRGDAGMIRARLPEHVAPAHALEATEYVLDGVVERMAHMQRAGHVRRRDHDGVGLCVLALGATGAKSARIIPARGDTRLDGSGVEGLVHHAFSRSCPC